MTHRIECVVIGAGVIGLSIARQLALSGVEVLVLEAAAAIGTETSGRNSEIIHAGIHYPTGSVKAVLCVTGKNALYAYCAANGIGHQRCGKLIVATSDKQIPALQQVHKLAVANGVTDLQWYSPAEVHDLEPEVFCIGALWSPSTGIIDSHGLMLAYQADAEAAGAVIVLRSPVTGGVLADDGILLTVAGEPASKIKANWVVNAAGLSAHRVAAGLQGLPAQHVPPVYFAKGNYFSMTGKPAFSRPVYPLPEAAGLGIHATVDLSGQVRFGPDVEWVDHVDYRVNPARAESFYRAVRQYYPALADGALQPAYCGIRPKLHPVGEAKADFLIQDKSIHSIDGLVNLYGIESPGLTASLAIAAHVAGQLGA